MRRGATHGPAIVALRSYALHLPLKETLSSAQVRWPGREKLLIEIETSDGISGWGEACGPTALLQPILHGYYAPLLLGRDGLQTEVLWRHLWRESYQWARRGVLMAAISGIDMALWDVKGQLLKRPCVEMMGGQVYERVPCYATGLLFHDRPETELIPRLLEEAASYMEAGFRGVKMQVGRNFAFDSQLIRRLRETLPHAPLMADGIHSLDLMEATQLGRVLSEYKFAFFEDALSPEFPALYKELAARVDVPLAAGEWEQTRAGFQNLLTLGQIDLVQLNLSYCGGPTEALQIRALAGAHGKNTVAIGFGSTLNLAASLHFMASGHCVPGRLEQSPLPLGWTVGLDPIVNEPFASGITLEGGMAVPSGPGWGVTIDRDDLSRMAKVQETTQ